MKTALVIRSSSFQHMDGVMDTLRRDFSDADVTILTHAHGAAQARKYAHAYGKVRVAVYPHRGNFSFFRPPGLTGTADYDSCGLPAEPFDAVIIPVGNDSGSGFLNVFLFTLRVRANRRFMCNRLLQMKEFSGARIIASAAAGILYSIFAAAAAAAVGTAILAAGFVYSLIIKFGVNPGVVKPDNANPDNAKSGAAESDNANPDNANHHIADSGVAESDIADSGVARSDDVNPDNPKPGHSGP
jgi:hypothetical protein